MTSTSADQYRRGVTVLEAMAALGLMAMAAVTTVEVLGLCAGHRRGSEQLLAAQLEAANVEEQIAAIPYDRVTDEAMRRFKLSPEACAALSDGELRIEVSQFDSTALPHKRIRVNVSWPAAADSARSVGLTSWKFAPSGDPARSETEK